MLTRQCPASGSLGLISSETGPQAWCLSQPPELELWREEFCLRDLDFAKSLFDR